ncbi:MAG: ATP-binding protein [Lactobacillaceae bacterium]|jgi:hypothetical protein|nr:ATP-binding protein [Lactobacillaceae bacterium]
MLVNPFKPVFDYNELSYINQNLEIENMVRNSLLEYSTVGTTLLLTGIRGSGKTSILTYLRKQIIQSNDQAYSKVIPISLNMSNELLDETIDKLASSINKDWFEDLSIEFGIPGLIKFSSDIVRATNATSFRGRLENILNIYKNKDLKVLFLIDEVQKTSEQLTTFTQAYSMVLSEGYKVGLVMAGLPNAIYKLTLTDPLTFIARAPLMKLEPLSNFEVEQEYQLKFKEIGADRLDFTGMSQFVSGNPYLFQAQGYKLWELLEKKVESDTALSMSQEYALQMLYKNIYSLVIRGLSENERQLLIDISKINNGINVSTNEIINQKNKWKYNNIGSPRVSLVQWDLIDYQPRSPITIKQPYLVDYLKTI